MLEIHFARIEAAPTGGDDVTIVPLTQIMRGLEYIPSPAPINVTRTPGRRMGSRPVASTVDNVTETLTVRVLGDVSVAQRALNQAFALALEWSKQFRRDMRFVVRVRDPQRHQEWFEAELFNGRAEMDSSSGRVLRITWEREPYWSGDEQILHLRNTVSDLVNESDQILDDFNRANEGPPPSSNWSTPTVAVPGLRVIDQSVGVSDDVEGSAYSYWRASADTTFNRVFVTLRPDYTDGSDLQSFRIILRARVQIPTSESDLPNCYEMAIGYSFTYSHRIITLRSYLSHVQMNFGSYETDWKPGDSFMLEVENVDATHVKLNGYWRPAGGAWELAATVTIAADMWVPIYTSGSVGLGLEENPVKNVGILDDFGVGPVQSVPETSYALSIYNHDDDQYGHDNFVIVDAPPGDVPTPARIRIRNTHVTNPGSRLKEVRIGWYHRPHYLTIEGEASEIPATIDYAAQYSNEARAIAQNYQWTLPQNNIVDYVGLFRVLAQGDLSGCSWTLSTGYELTKIQTSKAVTGLVGWTDLGLISLPPGGYVHPFRYPVRFWLDGSSAPTGNNHLDYVMFMPILQYRHLKFERGYNCAVGACIVDDGIRGELIYDFDGQALPIVSGWGDQIEIWPANLLPGNQQQMLVFAMTDDFDRADALRTADIQVTVRPRYNVLP